jgi:hypothetical protein
MERMGRRQMCSIPTYDPSNYRQFLRKITEKILNQETGPRFK